MNTLIDAREAMSYIQKNAACNLAAFLVSHRNGMVTITEAQESWTSFSDRQQ